MKKPVNIAQLIFATIIVAVLLNLFVINRVENSITGRAISESSEAQLIVANRISAIIESDTENLLDRLYLIASYTDIKNSDPEKCNKKIEEILPYYKDSVKDLARLDANGNVFCASEKMLLGLDLSEREHVEKILSDPKHSPVISRAKRSDVGNKWSASIHVPTFNEKKEFSGTLRGEVLFDDLTSEYLQNITSIKGSRAIIVDDLGDIVYYDKSPDAVGKNWQSPGIQAALGKNEKLNNIFETAISGSSGHVLAKLSGEESVISYANAEIFPDRNWVIMIAAPTSGVVSESTGGPSAFALLYGTSSLSIIAVAGIILFLLSGLAKYEIKELKRKVGGRR